MSVVGEVVHATLTRFAAQVPPMPLDWPHPPAFGSFVAADAGDGVVVGLVCHVEVAAGDALHRPAALGLDPEALRREHPHLFDLARVEFAALVVGHGGAGGYVQQLPDRPPSMHALVRALSPGEVAGFTDRLEFLRVALGCAEAPADALVAACLRQAAAARADGPAFLAGAGKRLAGLLRGDYARLSALLEGIA